MWKKIVLLVLLLAVAGTAVGLWAKLRGEAHAALDTRYRRVAAEVEQFATGIRRERPVVLGPAEEGNAAAFYGNIIRAWFPVASDPTAHAVDLGPLLAHLDEYLAGDPQNVPADLAAFLDAQSGVEQHVRDGLRQTTCDWDARRFLGRGPGASPIELTYYAAACDLLVALAHRTTDPEEALRLGLETVGFAADIALGATLPHGLVAAAKVQAGCESIVRTLVRFHVSRSRGSQVAAQLLALDATWELDIDDYLRAEKLVVEVASCRAGLDDAGGGAGPLYEIFPAILWDRELEIYGPLMDRAIARAGLPFAEHGEEDQKLEADLQDADGLLVQLIPRFRQAKIEIAEAHGAMRAAALLAVAAGVRTGSGSFPRDAAALAALLGHDLPEDPFGGGLIAYRVDPESHAAIACGRGPDGAEGPHDRLIPEEDPSGLIWFDDDPERYGGHPVRIGLVLAPRP